MDFDWTDNIDIGLEVGKKYVVTSENGLIKYTMIYCGRGTTTHPHTGEEIDGHRFKDPNSEKWDNKCNSWWSDGNLIEHMKSGRIEPYDESINEDLDWIKDADTYRGDYVIKRRGGRHTYVTVTDEYSHGPNSQPAVKYYIGDRLPVLALSPSQGSMLISTLQEKIDNGQWERLGTFTEPRTSVYDSMLGESFEWVEDVPANMTPGKQYYVKQPSGVWTAVEYCGEGETEHPDTGEKIMGHRFKDIDSRTGKCNEWWSNESLKYKIDNNLIREYDSEWTILDDVEFGTLNDIEGRNFVIYFENGVDIGDTIELQKRLFDMGYHFPNRGDEFKPVTNEDTSGKIIMFECYNWDTSNDKYKRMPSDYRDRGIMLMVKDKQEDSSFFRSDKERQLQNRFSTVIDHNAVVVNGYDYLNNNINESEFDWVSTVSDDPIRWKKPKVTLDNVERDNDDWPVHYGDGEGEVWIDFEKYSNVERLEIIDNIEKHLGKPLAFDESGPRDVIKITCTANNIKGLLLHCGHEENHFFSQENHVCCMRETYEEFKEYEEKNGYMPFRERPIVDGGIFLDKVSNLNEGFYYKGVNPTVDLIVIRGDKVLLIKRGEDSEAEPGKWALPGGFHDSNAKKGEEWREDKESALEAAKREVKEETGLDVDRIDGLNFQLVGVFEGGGRDPRDKEDSWTRSTVYMVHIPESEGDDVRGMDDAQRAEWVPLSLVLQRKLAFDHHKIIEKGLQMNESDAFNNLDKLLTEDFDWAEDVPPFNPLDEDWLIFFHNGREYKEIQEWLFSNNLCWDGHFIDNPEDEDCGEPWPPDNKHGFFFKYPEGTYSGGIDAYSYSDYELKRGNMDKRIEEDFPNHKRFEWSDIGRYFKFDRVNEDFSWTQDVGVTKEAIRDLMSNCEDIPVTNFNLDTNSPYTRRGKMNIMYYSMCPYWWDRFKDLPVDEHGRGKGEWFVDNDRGETKVAVIMPDRNGVTDIRSEDNEDMSAITYDLKRIEPYFNGKSSELWLFLDDNGDPRYDLLPDHLVDRVRKGFEGVEKSTTIEENFDWTDDIPSETDIDLWEKVSGDIDNEVSGPWSGDMREMFPSLAGVLDEYNIDIGDMSDFFMYPPDGPKDKNGDYITNHQLHELHQDLIDLGISLTPEQERELNLESINESDFDWVNDIKLSLGFDDLKLGDVVRLKDYDNNDWEVIDIYMSDPRMTGKPSEKRIKFKAPFKNSRLELWKSPLNSEDYFELVKANDTLNESDFDWVNDAPDYDAYRFFDVYVCGDNQYDEETGEDECLDGGSYFLRIPKEEVDEIWDLDIDDMGGPGDEGLGVIQWAQYNAKIDPDDYAMVEYVREIDREEFCMAVRHSNQDICGDFINESKVLTEGRYDKVTNELSKTAMINIKKGKKRFEDKIRLFTRTFVDIVFYVKYSDEYDNPRVYAATHLDPKAIRSYFKNKRIIFEVEVPTENGVIIKGHLPELLSEIKNIVRHEIEHVTQHRFKDRQRKGFFSSRSYPENLTYTEYLTEPYETEAYVRGLYKKAKTLRKPFNDVLNDYFERLRIEGELTPEEVEIVKTHWLAYANKHLPMSVNRKYGYELTESNDFEWTDDVKGKPQVMDIFRVKGTRYTWTVVEELEGDRFMFKIRPKPDSSSAYQELSLDAVNHWLHTGNWIPEGREKYWHNLRFNR